jgi:phage antirepressor YoqD-like protein
MFDTVEIGNGATREALAYRLDRDAFSLIVMGFTGEKAFQWKLDYIEAFNRMEEKLRRGTTQPFDPNDAASLRGVLLGYTEKVLALEAQVIATETRAVTAEAVVEEQRPLVDAYHAFLDDEGLCGLATAAAAIEAPHTLFFAWVRERGFLFERDGFLQARADLRRDGQFKLRAVPGAYHRMRQQTMVTRSGLAWLRQRWIVGPGRTLALQAAVASRQGSLPGL